MVHLKRFPVGFLPLVLSACVFAKDPGASLSLTGANLGQASWVDVAVEESKLLLPPQLEKKVIAVQRNDLPNRYQEKLHLGDENWIFVDRKLDGYFVFPIGAAEFRQHFKETKVKNAPLSMAALQINRVHDVAFSRVSHAGFQCLAYISGLGRPEIFKFQPSGFTAYLKGLFCQKPGQGPGSKNLTRMLSKVKANF